MSTTSANPRSSLPLGLLALSKAGFKSKYIGQVGRFATYITRFLELKLNLGDETLCIWVNAENAQGLSTSDLLMSLEEAIQSHNWHGIILIFIDGAETGLRQHPFFNKQFVIIDESDQKFIAESVSPSLGLRDVLLKQVSRRALAPYTGTETTGSGFFNRRTEMNKLLQHKEKNFLIRGIRYVGKTTLAKHFARRLDDAHPPGENQTRRLYVYCKNLRTEIDLLRQLTIELAPMELKEFEKGNKTEKFKKRMFKRFFGLHGGRVTFLLDEFDHLLTDITQGTALGNLFQEAWQYGYANFIVIVNQGTPYTLTGTDPREDPFQNFFEDIIELKQFKRSDVEEMITRPMELLKVTIQNRASLVSRIYEDTSGLPFFVQYYCKSLLEYIDREERDYIVENDLEYIYHSTTLRESVLTWFMDYTSIPEKAMLYAIILEASQTKLKSYFSLSDIDKSLKKCKLTFDGTDLDKTCQNLVRASILNQVGINYEFAFPLLITMLRANYNVEFLINKVREDLHKRGVR